MRRRVKADMSKSQKREDNIRSAARVKPAVLANVVHGDCEGGGVLRLLARGDEEPEHLVVVLVELHDVLAPESLRLVYLAPLELARPHLRRVLLERAEG